MKRNNKEKGITLIALIITIILLLILAGVTINLTMGDNAIFKISQDAAQNHKIAQAREKLELVLGHARSRKANKPKL